MLRRWVFVTAVMSASLLACGGSPAPQPRSHTTRQSVARRELPAELQPLVPKHGAVATGGGVKSAVFRVIVDTDAKTIYTGSAPAGATLGGTLLEERTRELTPANEHHLMQLCANAWSEPEPVTAPERVEGYVEYLIVADGDEIFFLDGRGPITRPAAAKAIEALRAAAAL
jgi:hypothetical protein